MTAPALSTSLVPVQEAPPPSAQPAKAPSRRWVAVREIVLTSLVLIFAFLVASFVARNADVWLHLATGRLIAHGALSFGTDPFAYTTTGVYWTNHAWLYDFDPLSPLLDGRRTRTRRPQGGADRRPGRRDALWFGGRANPVGLPAFCTALAVLALSPRLLLQPICVSFVLLGLTLWILWRISHARTAAAPSAPRLMLRAVLIPLCAVGEPGRVVSARPGAGRPVLDRRLDATADARPGGTADAGLAAPGLSAGLSVQPAPLSRLHAAGRPDPRPIVRRTPAGRSLPTAVRLPWAVERPSTRPPAPTSPAAPTSSSSRWESRPSSLTALGCATGASWSGASLS